MTTGNYTDEIGSFTALGTTFTHTKSRVWNGPNSSSPYERPESVDVFVPPVFKGGAVVREGHWRKKYIRYAGPRRLRQLPDHPYTTSGWETRMDYATAWSPYYGTQQLPIQVYAVPGNLSELWTNNDDIALLQAAREAIAGSSANFGVMGAEARQSCTMIGESAKSIARALHEIKRGRVSSALNALGKLSPSASRAKPVTKRDISNRWLEMSYGWMPLVKDAHEGAKFLGTHYSTPTPGVRLTVQRNALGVHTSRERGQSMHFRYCGNYELRGVINSRCSKRMLITVYEKDVVQLSGLTDPASVAWELLPWSFVADWFIPIGNYLQARQLPSGVRCHVVTCYRRSSSFTGEFLFNQYTTGFDQEWELTRIPALRYTRYNFDRTITESLPDPPLPEIKTLSNVPTWTRAANAVALLTQRFAGKA